jgi:hypothetical protein
MATVATYTPISTITVGHATVSHTATDHWGRQARGTVTVALDGIDEPVILTHDEARRLGLALLAGARQAHLEERAARAGVRLRDTEAVTV